MSEHRRGGAAALAAFLLWGGLSLYLKALAEVPAAEVLAYRILGGLVVSLAALAVSGGLGELRELAGDRWRLRRLAASAVAIATNWGVFIWAVAHGRALEASMGYFIFPLVTVVLARVVLGERLGPRRWMAVGVVASGVVWLALTGGGFPWVALTLALCFAGYGLLRKTTPVSALGGLVVEAALLAPLAILYLLLMKGGAAPHLGHATIGLLALAGPVTVVPLWLFTYGARRVRLSTLGLMMYVNPTVQMLVAVFVFGEPFTPAYGVAFAAIWAGLALYSWPERRICLPVPSADPAATG